MRVHVNAAASVDGKLSTRRREQVALSGPEDFDRVDRLRADSDAVMVGLGTVLADDPSLTVDDAGRRAARRERGDPPNPARVVADSRARTPLDAAVLDDAAATHLLVGDVAPEERVAALEDAGGGPASVAVHRVAATGDGRVDLADGLSALESEAGIDQLMVEGGGELVFSLFEAGLVDRLSVFVAPTVVGGREAPTLADGEGFIDRESFPALSLESVERVDEGVLVHWDC